MTVTLMIAIDYNITYVKDFVFLCRVIVILLLQR